MDGPITLVLGASPKPHRYANMAVRRLRSHGHEVVAVGRRAGRIEEMHIVTEPPDGISVDTVTMYLNAANQVAWSDRLLALAPRRIIFNPGAENRELAAAMEAAGTEVVEGCTLVMLAAGTY